MARRTTDYGADEPHQRKRSAFARRLLMVDAMLIAVLVVTIATLIGVIAHLLH